MNKRLLSLDALRGFDMMFIVGLFALFYYIIDVRGYTKWTLPFAVVGLNSITIYLAWRIIPFRKIAEFFLGGLAGLCPDKIGALIMAIGAFAAGWLFLYFLYRKKVFLKV
ncbi:MAG: hypothetical protein IJV01_03635 [Bacteroidales bacterium]|nr:hypothetical protein [Bacteroidales bacterium]